MTCPVCKGSGIERGKYMDYVCPRCKGSKVELRWMVCLDGGPPPDVEADDLDLDAAVALAHKLVKRYGPDALVTLVVL